METRRNGVHRSVREVLAEVAQAFGIDVECVSADVMILRGEEAWSITTRERAGRSKPQWSNAGDGDTLELAAADAIAKRRILDQERRNGIAGF